MFHLGLVTETWSAGMIGFLVAKQQWFSFFPEQEHGRKQEGPCSTKAEAHWPPLVVYQQSAAELRAGCLLKCQGCRLNHPPEYKVQCLQDFRCSSAKAGTSHLLLLEIHPKCGLGPRKHLAARKNQNGDTECGGNSSPEGEGIRSPRENCRL